VWHDRIEAGKDLAEALVRRGYGGRKDTIVLGVPRGGVEVAAEVAEVLGAPLDVVVVRKVGAPGNPEFAAGAVDVDGNVYGNPSAGVSDEWLKKAAEPEHAEALRRLESYRGDRPPLDLAGRVVIIVDDGIATGLTAQAALRWLRRHGAAKTVLAAPAMAPDAVRRLETEADEVVALDTSPGFSAVGQFYASFPQLSDAEVTRLLAG